MNVRTELYISLFYLVCNVYKHWVVCYLRNVVQNEFSQRALIRQSSCTLYNNIYREIRKYPQCIVYSLLQKGPSVQWCACFTICKKNVYVL